MTLQHMQCTACRLLISHTRTTGHPINDHQLPKTLTATLTDTVATDMHLPQHRQGASTSELTFCVPLCMLLHQGVTCRVGGGPAGGNGWLQAAQQMLKLAVGTKDDAGTQKVSCVLRACGFSDQHIDLQQLSKAVQQAQQAHTQNAAHTVRCTKID